MPSVPLAFDPIEEGRRQWAEAGWEAAAPGMGVVGSVVRVHQLFLASLEEALAPFELRFARYEALLLLSFAASSRGGKMSMGKLAERLQVHSATATNVINRLEDQGLARRRTNPQDARSAFALITPRGRKVALAATEAVRREVLIPFALSERESQRLFTLLRKVRIHAGDFAIPPPGAETGDDEPLPAWAKGPLPFDPVEAAREQWVRAGWADSSRGVVIVASVSRVDQILMNELERTLRPLHLSFARFEALMILLFARGQRLPLQKLSDRLQVHPASVTNAIQRLQKERLIRREPNPADGRSSFATLTAEGHRTVLRAADALQAGVMTDLGLTAAESDATFQLLRKIRLAAGDFVPATAPRPKRPALRGKPPNFQP